ncbi:MAG: isoleucine--tRNA ligase [Desulfobulbaceae bacterium A2]|nr:MAG: isoleucine--tRNA ligase [Desulfobulbaceae bacterium A2]
MDFRKTLNLPQTDFPMKADLARREPLLLARWDEQGIYAALERAGAGRPLFVLHDGPPYANGHIHLGTAFNKVLKDIILKSRRLAGYHCPYVPGWDCHGLPIEHNVDKDLGKRQGEVDTLGKRGLCRSYAERWVATQKAEFRRLGVLGDWDQPYLTMNYAYEAAIAREFHRFLLAGSVVRSRKPVYWCATCHTALAEAEVEYHDHESPSVYVKFFVNEDLGAEIPALAGRRTALVIWTTTPWTLPANLAVALHPDFIYTALQVGDEAWIVAEALAERCRTAFGLAEAPVLASFAAPLLAGKHCRHPFMERDSLVVLADYVTADSGTGCVHTAPGHGAEDYLTGLRYGLDTLSPVNERGVFTAEAGRYAGEKVPAVNGRIIEDLRREGFLVRDEAIRHSYPHCWRCKKPVMYRATAQWFVSMERNDLRHKALAAIEQVRWTPAWGMQRIHGMVENRPDWCLSRQRSWGVPITVLRCDDCGEVLVDPALCARIEEVFSREGADAWFRYPLEWWLPEGAHCRSCNSTNFVQEKDILDVWFDSGVSHAAVCEERPELRTPADLYLEGSDQHRGWFQSSLLAAVGTRGCAPYLGVLTHGYVVDGEGRKMSKSVGNVIAPQQVIDRFGAEILRLWVASEDYRDDVKVSDEILGHVADAYRKIRNTIRFLLGNLYDFDPARHALSWQELDGFDQYVLRRFDELRQRLVRGYESYEFHHVFHGLHTFCGVTLSSLYLDVTKDRLYCSGADDRARRAAQTVMHRIADGLLRLMAPVLSFTASEAWDFLYHRDVEAPLEGGVLFAALPPVLEQTADEDDDQRWDLLLAVRAEITRVLELARRDKIIGHPLEAELLVAASPEIAAGLEGQWQRLETLAIVSQLRPVNELSPAPGLVLVESEGMAGLRLGVRRAAGEKCERCWIRADSVGQDATYPTLCRRCAEVVSRLPLVDGQ